MGRRYLGLMLVAGLALTLGCASSGQGTSSQRANSEVSVQHLDPQPPSVMVRRSSELPVYILVDSDEVPSRFNVHVTGTYHRFAVTDFHWFAERDLREFFANYFDEVHVLVDEEPDESAPHFVVDLRVTRLRMGHAGGGHAYDYAIGELNWALGLAYSESDDYLLSLGAESVGSPTKYPGEMVSTVIEGAIADLGEAFADGEIRQKILALTESAQENAEENAEEAAEE